MEEPKPECQKPDFYRIEANLFTLTYKFSKNRNGNNRRRDPRMGQFNPPTTLNAAGEWSNNRTGSRKL